MKIKKVHVLYYLDEVSVLLLGIVAVVFSEAIKKVVYGKTVTKADLFLGWPQLVVSCVVAIGYYGSVNQIWKFNDRKKPNWFKRASTAILLGISWRDIFTSGEN